MRIAVVKFGGTSVSTGEGRKRAQGHIEDLASSGYSVVTVVSAMGRKGDPYSTDTLLSLLGDVKVSGREIDLLASCGEIISAVVFSNCLNGSGIISVPLTGGQAGIITDGKHGSGSIMRVEPGHLHELLEKGVIPVVTGFQGITEQGEITTLGRGGSDLTAIALASALSAEVVELYKDVDGVMTHDPKLRPNARVVRHVSANSLMEMSLKGCRLVHSEAVRLAIDRNVSFRLRNNFSGDAGTAVTPGPDCLVSPSGNIR